MAMLLHLLVASLAFIFSVDGHIIKCSAPTAVRGQPATVTCHFGRDIQKERRDFKIHKYDREGNFQVVVLNCLWNGHTRPYCETKPGHFFNEHVNDSATLQIQNATEDNVGTYVCQLTPVVEEDVLKNCFLAVKDPTEPVTEESSTRPYSEKECEHSLLLPILLTAIVTVVAVAILYVVLKVIIRWRRSLKRKRNERDVEQGLPLLVNEINEISDSGMEALLLGACRSNRIQMVWWLIESGAPINCRDNMNGDTPLHVASRCGHESILEFLLFIGADFTSRNRKGFTPLHKASKYGRQNIVEKLVAIHADVNAEGRDCITPLKLALENDYTEVIGVLLRAGAKPDEEDIQRMTPLNLAYRNGGPKVMSRFRRFWRCFPRI